MTEKRITYTTPERGKEEFVRHIFSMFANDLGFEITNIQKSFPDCTAIDCRHEGKEQIFVEFEYEAHNFVKHGHDDQMLENERYIVVCWSGKGIDLLPPTVEVIVLSDPKYNIEIQEYPYNHSIKSEKPLYRIIGYNTNMAGGLSFPHFENTRIFRTNIRFKNKYLPKGSVIVLYEKGWLIGEITVEEYIHIDREPKSKYEKELYSLVRYPVTIDEAPLEYDDWLKGHILYTNFKIYDPPVNFNILARNMSRGGSLNLSFNELQKIRGRSKS